MRKLFLSCTLVVFTFSLNAQPFIRSVKTETPSFKAMQLQFNDWKQIRDLKKEKGWKYYKRWENEVQLHCNSNGEPAGEADYINACINAASAKEIFQQSKLNSGSWVPSGAFNVPNNYAGYMTNGIGRINCVAFHPTDPNTYFVGVAQGGLWKTSDNGVTYSPLTDNLPVTRISDICIDPANPNTMYISVCDFEYIGFSLFLNGRKRNTHYGLGVYKTTDGGLSWNPTGLSFQLTNGDASLIRKVLVDPNNSNKVVACGVSGMYQSLNAGSTWTQISDSLFWDMVQDPSSPNTLYAATGWVMNSNTGSAAVYKSTNFGSSWQLLNTGIPLRDSVQRVKLAVAPNDNTCIYALTVDTYGGLHGIYKSTDAGTSWNMQYNALNLLDWYDGTGSGGQGTYDVGFLVHPTNKDIVYVGGINIWASSDGAVTFDPVAYWTTDYGPSLHADIHFMAYQPLTGSYFVACDGGLWRTAAMISQTWNDAYNGTLWPTVWQNVSDGMNVTSFYRISSSKTASGELLAGAQDNASFYYDGSDWYSIVGGDGMDNYIDTTMPGVLIAGVQYGDFYDSPDGGMSVGWLNANPAGENGEWTTPLVADYNNYGVLYAGYGNVHRSTDNGMTWGSISNFPFNPWYQNEISALAVSHSDASTIYAARRVRYEFSIPSSLWKTNDQGMTWSDVSPGLPDSLYFTSVEISRSNASEVYVTMAGFSAGNKVFKTTNGGATWTNVTYNLPNIPVNCIKNIPGTNDFMLATDVGVYVLYNGATSWTFESFGLPNVIVTDIEFNPALNKVYVSTFGRGIWASDIDLFTGKSETETVRNNFKLYPSANNGSFTIETSGGEQSLLEVYDVGGRLVHSEKISVQVAQCKLQLNTGTYFAKIRCGKQMEVKKFIVQN